MIPWIQVYSNLQGHKKTCKLRDGLGFSANYQAVGVVVCLWSWAAVNAPDGNLTGYSDRDIADAVGWKKSPGKLLGALAHAGFIDRNDDVFQIHDWEEHAALLMDSEAQQRKNTRDRVRRYRERQKQKESENVAPECNVTGNACNAPTLPNLTLPNLTLPNQFCDGESAPVREASEEELASIGLKPGEYMGVSSELVEDIRQITMKLFGMPSAYNTIDARNVFERVALTIDAAGWARVYLPAAGLLEYAFEAAAYEGHAKKWSYVDGILNRLRARGIQTAEQAREWDEIRPDRNL